MRTYQHPIYQDNTMAIRAEYDEEKRVFDLMKKFLYIVGTITAIVVFLLLLVNSPCPDTSDRCHLNHCTRSRPAGCNSLYRVLRRHGTGWLHRCMACNQALKAVRVGQRSRTAPHSDASSFHPGCIRAHCLPSPVVEGVESQASA